MKAELPLFLDCEQACDCGCEADGEWHYEGSIGCQCVNQGCACVVDRPGMGVIVGRY